MKTAFWDTSALVPLCLQQEPTSLVRDLLERYHIAVWWATSVEMRSAFERLLRMQQLTSAEHAAASNRLELLRSGWQEIQPGASIRSQAELYLMTFPLKAADALQLAAAWAWCSAAPQGCVFISGDKQLLDAARQAGFKTVMV